MIAGFDHDPSTFLPFCLSMLFDKLGKSKAYFKDIWQDKDLQDIWKGKVRIWKAIWMMSSNS